MLWIQGQHNTGGQLMTLFSPTAGRQFAVVDVETTGFGRHDRVLEVAIVVLDESLEVIDEYDTLIDPQRDVGPVHVHGITPSMLAGAPTFGEVAAAVAARLNERILVAHNLSFDERMICREYERLRADVDPGEGVCTLRQTGEKLNCACRTWGIELDHHHRALADARATAGCCSGPSTNLPTEFPPVSPGCDSRSTRERSGGRRTAAAK